MSAKYGVTIQLSGPQEDKDKCVTELAASLREDFTDKFHGQVSYTLRVIPGSYWANVRKGDEFWKTDDIVVSYMMTWAAFWSALHDEAIKDLAMRWPSLTLFVYGDSYDDGDGFRILYVGGKVIVDDVFHLDQDDSPTDVKRRVYGDGINENNLFQYIPEKFADAFRNAEVRWLPQEWDEVRAEIAAATKGATNE
jgi:hypothetical protein